MDFTAVSTDGSIFNVHADGRWRRRGLGQHDPESATASYVIDKVSQLAADCPILASATLERKANAHLGRAANVVGLAVRMRWARVHIDVDPEIRHEAQTRMRLIVQAKAEREDKQLRIGQAVVLRDLLREDPTLALAHLLLECPGKIDNQTIGGTIKAIGEQIAAYAPGAAWVKTAQMLEKSFGELAPDARQAIINRICRTLTEFGEQEVAQHIMEAHGLALSQSPLDGSHDYAGNLHKMHADGQF